MASIDSLQKNFRNLASLANNGRNQATEAENELETTKRLLGEAEKTVAEHESSLKSIKRQLESTTKEKLTLEAELSTLSEVREELSKSQADAKRLLAEVAERKKQLTDANRMIGGLEKKFGLCHKERTEAENRAAELAKSLEAALAGCSTNEGEMWAQKERASKAEQEVQLLRRELGQAKEAHRKLEEEIGEMRSKDTATGKDMLALKEAVGMLEGQLSAKAGLESLVEECQALQKQLHTAQEGAEQAAEDHATQLALVEDKHRLELDRLRSDHASQGSNAESNYASLEAMLEKAVTEKEVVQAEADKGKQELTEAVEKLAGSAREVAAGEKARARLTRTLEEVQKELFEAKQERNQAESEALAAEEKAKALEEQLKEAQSGGDAVAALESAHKAALAKLAGELERERKKLENVQSEYMECKKDRNKAEGEALEAEEALRDLQEKYDRNEA